MWHGYFTITRATLGQSNWDDLITLVNEIQSNGQSAEYQLTRRDRSDDDAYNYEARYNEGAVSFDKFAQKLAVAFDVDVNDITINESLETYGIEATYVYGGDDRFTLQLMGCNADDDLCSWGQSASATRSMIADNPVEWGEVQA